MVDSTPQSQRYIRKINLNRWKINLSQWQKVVAVEMIVDDIVGDRRQAAPICVDRTWMIYDKRKESRW